MIMGPAALNAGDAAVAVEAIGHCIYGMGTALLNMPQLVDVSICLSSKDEAANAFVCSVWNGAYSLGSAVALLAGEPLYHALGLLWLSHLMVGLSLMVLAILVVCTLPCQARAATGTRQTLAPDGKADVPSYGTALDQSFEAPKVSGF
jgi:hypothetical protein